MIYIIRERATPDQIEEMSQMLQTYIKLAVDIDRGILAGGGAMHADCEAVLLEDGSQQEYIWGADWNPWLSKYHLSHLSIFALDSKIHPWKFSM